MARDIEAILKEALALPAEDRAALAEFLLASLDGDADEAAGVTDIEPRTVEFDAGIVQTLPWHEGRRRLFDRARPRAVRRLREGLDLHWTRSASRDDLHRR